MPRSLPAWPVVFFGVAFPVMWVLGLGFAFLPVSGALAAFVMIRRRHAVLPPAWFLWFGYLVIALASVVQIDTTGRLIGYVLRLGMVLGATALAVYVYSATPRSIPTGLVYRSMAWLWTFVIVGGWLGILLPEVILQTPFASVVPGGLLSNDLVTQLVRPRFAQIEYPYGADPIIRPAAPFQATNGWGCNIALLAPLMVRYLTMLSGWRRWLLLGISVLGIVPALATLNRGLFIGFGIALVYVGARALIAGRFRLAGAVAGVLVAAALLATVTGVAGSITERTETGGTNETRASLYEEAIDRTLQSPLLGYGAPRPSLREEISVGTQGHVWNIMVSHGFLALAFYLAYFLVTAWQGRNARNPADAGHLTAVVGLVLVVFYGLDGPQIAVLLMAGALSVRDVRTRPWEETIGEPSPASGRLAVEAGSTR